jgi:hypothetical protein
VSGNDDLHASAARVDVELRDVMQGINADVADLNKLRLSQTVGPSAFVIVPADRRHRRQRG